MWRRAAPSNQDPTFQLDHRGCSHLFIEFKRPFFKSATQPVNRLQHFWAPDQPTLHPVLSGELEQKSRRHNHQNSLTRQNQQQQPNDKKHYSKQVPDNKQERPQYRVFIFKPGLCAIPFRKITARNSGDNPWNKNYGAQECGY